MASIEMTANWPDATLLRGINRVIFHTWTARTGVGRGVFNVKDSTQFQEDTLTVGGIGIMPTKLEGASIDFVTMNEGHRQTFTHVDRGYGMRITRQMRINELYGVMEKQAAELSRSALATEETVLANHFNNGFDSAFTGPDGVELFSTAHIREDGSTFANTLTSQADLSQTSLEQALIDFADIRDGGGKRLMIEPASLLVPREEIYNAKRLLNSTLASENDTNAINPIQGDLTVLPWNYLTDTDSWNILAEKEDHELVLYDREAFWTDYQEEFETKDYKVSGLFSQSSGWGDPRGVFGVQGI